MQTFIVSLTDGRSAQVVEVHAHFLRHQDVGYPWSTVKFYVKPHWWNRARCVACFHWRIVSSITNAAAVSDDSILKSWGVKP